VYVTGGTAGAELVEVSEDVCVGDGENERERERKRERERERERERVTLYY
jgi:hypothetical protein